jgi:hypothetical protein
MSKKQWMFVWEWASCRSFTLVEATKVAQQCIIEGVEINYDTMDKMTWRKF